ncbi:nucleotide pyrophosphohydrolase [Pandoraea commovens]|uniref:Nucleotide pyrophosphohydrolase n=2 Tax=Pandoraea commovens TaxID=2508289 RepID=A0A5E4YGG5_9BURK|nr:nucleotide pyrophosphohydrolase [Pandoraea commovens]
MARFKDGGSYGERSKALESDERATRRILQQRATITHFRLSNLMSDAQKTDTANAADTPVSPVGRLIDTTGLRAELQAFADARDWHQYHSPKNLAMALSVEVAELVEIFQWHTEAQANAVMQSSEARHVEQELADITMYLVRLTMVLGIDLNRAVADKLVLNAQKYPATKA